MRRAFLLLLLVGVCFAQPALAQVNPFHGSRGVPLTKADLTLLNDATNRLLARPELNVGATESWSNPQSGASGTVTAGDAVRFKGLACRIVQYQNVVPGPNKERSATVKWCKTTGGWKVG